MAPVGSDLDRANGSRSDLGDTSMTIPIPSHYDPQRREAIELHRDCRAFDGTYELRVGNQICGSERALIEALATIRQRDLDALLAELSAQRDRNEVERARWADFDPQAEYAAGLAREAMEDANFRKSPEGRQERQIELLEKIVGLLEAGRAR
jgi:hypothetical protein